MATARSPPRRTHAQVARRPRLVERLDEVAVGADPFVGLDHLRE
jgi:hypothetical protein